MFLDPSLMLSISRRDDMMTKILLEDERIEINTKNSNGWTAVMFACKFGDAYLVSQLLEMGASIENTDDQYSCNLCHIAILAGSLEVIEVLKHSKIQWNMSDWQGDTPLHLAVLYDEPEILKTLLQIKHINIFTKNKQGLTAYETAMETGNWNAIKLFNDHVIKNNIVNKEIES